MEMIKGVFGRRRLFRFLFLRILSLKHPANKIIYAYAGPDQKERQNEDNRSNHYFEISIALLIRRRKLVLRKIGRRTIHNYSVKLITKNVALARLLFTFSYSDVHFPYLGNGCSRLAKP